MPIVKVISRAAKSLMKNPKAPKIFIREVKRMDGGLPKLMEELLTHPETFSELAVHIRNGESKSAKKLVKALHQHYLDYLSEMGMLDEGVSPPMNKRLEDPDDKLNDGYGGAGAINAGESMPGSAGPSMAGPGAGMNNMAGGSDIFSGMNAKPQNPGELGAFSGFNHQGGGMSKPSMINANANKEFGYHNMIKEMGSYDNMKKAMSEYLGSK